MTDHTLTRLFAWFDDYSETYRHSKDSALAKTSELKYEHTLHVVGEMDRLTEALGLPDTKRRLARVIALFHDVGRFEQFKRYHTLADRLSVNHAELGVEVVREHDVFAGLPEDTITIIEAAIAAHNKFAIPDTYEGAQRFYTKLIRDADKLDILRVFVAVDLSDDREMLKKAYIELDESDTVSDDVIADFERRELVRIEHLRSRNDMRLLMLSWVFDLNFAHSLRRFRDRGDADKLLGRLPERPAVLRVSKLLHEVLSDPDRALEMRVA